MGEDRLRGGWGEYLRVELPGFFSLVVFLVITAVLFRNWEFALIVTASLGFHEMGHAVALSWYHLEYHIHFGMVGAWTWSRIDRRAYLSQLSNTYIHLAGPFFSLILALLALVLNALWKPESHHLLILANFSAQVGFLNLLPLGIITDGGKVLRRMVISVDGGRGKWVLLSLVAAAVLAPLGYVIYHLTSAGTELSATVLGFVLIGAWLAAGFFSELWRSGPQQLAGTRKMNARQLTFIALLFWDMLAILFYIIITTPFWLAPEYMVGLLDNIKLLITWFVRLI